MDMAEGARLHPVRRYLATNVYLDRKLCYLHGQAWYVCSCAVVCRVKGFTLNATGM